MEYTKFKNKHNIKYDFIIRTRPDLLVINKNVDFNVLNFNKLYSYYKGCKKTYACPNKFLNSAIGDEMFKNVKNVINIHKKLKTSIISKKLLNKLNLLEYYNLINFDIIDINTKNINDTFKATIDWFNISNEHNIEVQCYHFLIYLLFLENGKGDIFLKYRDTRVNIMFYLIYINNIETEIFSNEFSNIVYNNKQWLC